jgi:hypothetical protein
MSEQSWTPLLPPLLGTERQVDWATTERHKLLILAEHALRVGRSLPELPEQRCATPSAGSAQSTMPAGGWTTATSPASPSPFALGGVAAAWHPTKVD